MYKTILIVITFLSFSLTSIGQDSTLIPETYFQKQVPGTKHTEEWIEVHHVMYYPQFLQDAIDSVNGEKVILKMYGDSVKQNGIKKRADREFRSLLTNNKNTWLLTYRHLKPSTHIHFVIFTTNKKHVVKMTAGISDYDIDSIETIRRLKSTKSIKFINLNSKVEKHKF